MSFKINHFGTLIWVNEKGQLHREKGPAVIRANGNKYYFIHGMRHPKEIYLYKVKKL